MIRAFTSGVAPDDKPLFPIMPYLRFGKLSREDVESIVAYLRTLKPVRSNVPDRKLPFPLPLIVRTMPEAAQFPGPSSSFSTSSRRGAASNHAC